LQHLLLSRLDLRVPVLNRQVHFLLFHRHLPLLLLEFVAFTLESEDSLGKRIVRLKQLVSLIAQIELLLPDLVLSRLQLLGFGLKRGLQGGDFFFFEGDHGLLVLFYLRLNLSDFKFVAALEVHYVLFTVVKGPVEGFEFQLFLLELGFFELKVGKVLRVDLLVQLKLLFYLLYLLLFPLDESSQFGFKGLDLDFFVGEGCFLSLYFLQGLLNS
jgi:hypothetical protein